MAEREPVQVNHHGEKDALVLGDPERHQGGVVGFLDRAHKDLQPPRVALGEGIAVLRPGVPPGPERPVDVRHDDREARARRPVDHLVHVKETVRARRREGADAPGARPDAGGHGRVLALHRDVPAVEFS